MKTQPRRINALMATDNELQKEIKAISRTINSQSELKGKVVFYEDDYLSLQIDERGHELAKLKRQQMLSISQSNQIKKIKGQHLERQRVTKEKAQIYRQRYRCMKNQYVSLIQYLKVKGIYKNLPTNLLATSEQILLSSQTSNDEDKGNFTLTKSKDQVKFANKGSRQSLNMFQSQNEKQIVYVQKTVQIPVIIERIREVQVIKEVIVEQIVEVPVEFQVLVEKIVEVQVPIYIQRIVEVPVDKIVERVVQVIVERQVEIPIENIVQVVVERIIYKQVERIVELQKIVYVETIIEVPVQRIVQIQKEKIVQVSKIVERIVPFQRIVEVIVQKIKEVPIQRIVYVPSEPIIKIQQKIIQKIVYQQVRVQKIVQIVIPIQIFIEIEKTVELNIPQEDTMRLQYLQTDHGQMIDNLDNNIQDMIEYPRFIERQTDYNNDEIQELKQQNQILKAELFELKQDYKQLQDSPQQSLQKYDQQQIKKIIEQNHQMEQDILKYEQDKKQIVSLRFIMQTEIQEVNNRNQQLVNQLISRDDELQNYRKRINTLITLYDNEKNDSLHSNNQLQSEKEQNQGLRNMLQQIQEELQTIKRENQQLSHLIQDLQNQKQILSQLLNQKTAENQLSSNMEVLLQQKDQLLSNLKQKNQYYRVKLERMSSQISYLRINYQQEQELNDYKNLMIEELNKQKKRLEQSLQKHSEFSEDNVVSNNKYIKEKENENLPFEQNQSERSLKSQCRASPSNRHKILCSQTRQNSIVQIKQLIDQIKNAQIQKKLLFLIQQICLDADYKQRTNIQMKEMVVNLKDEISTLTKINHETSTSMFENKNDGQYAKHLEKLIRRYQILLDKANNQKLSMLTQISNLSKQNYQIKFNQSKQRNPEENNLVGQLQFQLELAKTDNQNMLVQNMQLKGQLQNLQNELVNKNKKIKALSMNVYLKQPNSYSVQTSRR